MNDFTEMCRYTCRISFLFTVDSRYYDTDGIRKMYQYNQTIDITSLNFYCLGMVGIQIWYRNKQYFVITDIVITRVYCNCFFKEWTRQKCDLKMRKWYLLFSLRNNFLAAFTWEQKKNIISHFKYKYINVRVSKPVRRGQQIHT